MSGNRPGHELVKNTNIILGAKRAVRFVSLRQRMMARGKFKKYEKLGLSKMNVYCFFN